MWSRLLACSPVPLGSGIVAITDDMPMTDSELLTRIAADIAYLRAVVEPLAPLAEMLRGQAGQMTAVQAAGLRKAWRKAARDVS